MSLGRNERGRGSQRCDETVQDPPGSATPWIDLAQGTVNDGIVNVNGNVDDNVNINNSVIAGVIILVLIIVDLIITVCLEEEEEECRLDRLANMASPV